MRRSDGMQRTVLAAVATTIVAAAALAGGCGGADTDGAGGDAFALEGDEQWVFRIGGESGTVTAGREFDGTLEGANAHRLRFLGGEPSILFEARLDATAGQEATAETWHARLTWQGTTYFTGNAADDRGGQTLGTPLTVEFETYEPVDDAKKWHVAGTIRGDFAHKGKGPEDVNGALTDPLAVEAKFDVLKER